MNEAVPRHQRPTKLKRFLFGAPYYPEHWTESDRAKDAEWMADAGVNVVRMAEFAWDRIEPERGGFDFSLFDETIARLGTVGIDTILCTPTATPPRWLTVEHDDWLRVDGDGRRVVHGSRQHCCTTNEGFRAESRRITQAMAEHYAGNARVIGWQTDNEFNCHFSECHCEACVEAFREWLKRRYGSVEVLNEAWGAAFWALTYNVFEHVPLPNRTRGPAPPNPSAELDYYRFISDSVIAFQRQQVDILRAANADWWITHNGLFQHIDYWRFTEDLDFLAVDIYPAFGSPTPEGAVRPAVSNERCRSASGGYIVPEQQSGPGGQRSYIHATPQPGRMRLWAYQSIAHGADGLLHFRWRTCRFGAEEYWNGVLSHDNVPRRRYDEFMREGNELKGIGAKIVGTTLDVQAAVLAECDQDEAHSTMPLDLSSPRDQGLIAYRELWRRHLPCGLVQVQDAFDGLGLIVLPSMPMMDDAFAAKLRAFVERGGVLLITARSAIFDRRNHVIGDTPPGLIRELCGAGVIEFGRIEPSEYEMAVGDGRVPSGGWYEILELDGAQALATWQPPPESGPAAASGCPAISVHQVGDGHVIYIGTFLTDDNAAAIIDLALARADIRPLADCHDGVEIMRRRNADRSLVFVLNHYPVAKEVSGLPAGVDLLTGDRCDGRLELGAWDVTIIEEERSSSS